VLATAVFVGVCLVLGCDRSTEPLGPPSLEAAFAGLEPARAIPVVLQTDQGIFRCSLDARRTPRAVALFVGLARGRAEWLDPVTQRRVTRPLYRDLAIHRAIPDVMIQSGCPVGDGTGTPGYRIEIEPQSDDAAQLSQPGALVLARYTLPPGRQDPNPPPPGQVLGSQFGITLVDMHHLAGQVSVIGRCRDLDVVRRISRRVGESKQPVMLRGMKVGE
jgi:peptidyl-prolyl cis-trans isomerase A (cyclophilin A)